MDKWSIHEIDTFEDVALCEALMKKFI